MSESEGRRFLNRNSFEADGHFGALTSLGVLIRQKESSSYHEAMGPVDRG